MNITDAVLFLRTTVPEFEAEYQIVLKKWSRTVGGLMDSQVVYDFGVFLKRWLGAESMEGPADEALQRAFESIECLIGQGDDLVVDAVYFGIIDTILLESAKLSKYTLGPLTAHELKRAQLAFNGII